MFWYNSSTFYVEFSPFQYRNLTFFTFTSGSLASFNYDYVMKRRQVFKISVLVLFGLKVLTSNAQMLDLNNVVMQANPAFEVSPFIAQLPDGREVLSIELDASKPDKLGQWLLSFSTPSSDVYTIIDSSLFSGKSNFHVGLYLRVGSDIPIWAFDFELIQNL